MATVLVTGAAGNLGRVLVPLLVAAGHDVRAMTRRAGRTGLPYEVVGDLLSPETLGAALDGVDTVVHLATSFGRSARTTEVEGTRNLLAARATDTNVLYLSIVGCDRTPFPYYRAKTAAEQLLAEHPRTTTVRATQFHGFARNLVRPLLAGRAVTPRGLRLQPVAEEFVAEQLVAAVADPTQAPREIGGPEPLTFAEIAARANGKRPVDLPLPGSFGRAVRGGSLLPGPGATLGGRPFSAA